MDSPQVGDQYARWPLRHGNALKGIDALNQAVEISDPAASHPLLAASAKTALSISAEDPAAKSSAPDSGSRLLHATILAFHLKSMADPGPGVHTALAGMGIMRVSSRYL